MAHRVGPTAVDRLVAEARTRFEPSEAEEIRDLALDRLHVTVDTRHVTFAGTCRVDSELDLSDALEVEAAVAAMAQALKDAGSTEPLDVRRARALAMLVRGDQIDVPEGGGHRPSRASRSPSTCT